jgi:hypothetical protein
VGGTRRGRSGLDKRLDEAVNSGRRALSDQPGQDRVLYRVMISDEEASNLEA